MEIDSAGAIFEELIEEDSTWPEAWLGLGYVASLNANRDSAYACTRRAIQLDSTLLEAKSLTSSLSGIGLWAPPGEGTFEIWFENGKLRESRQHADRRWQGVTTGYYESGSIKYMIEYFMGEVVLEIDQMEPGKTRELW